MLQTSTAITIHHTSTYFIISRLSDRLIFHNTLSLFGWYFRKKTSTCHSTRLRIALRVSTCIIHVQLAESRPKGQCLVSNKYSQMSVIRTSIIRNYWVIRRWRTVPTFFSIIYCNKTTYYSNFDYPKESIFRSDSSVHIIEIAIKLPFKIRSPKVTHGDHDFFVLDEFDLHTWVI